MSDAKTKLSGLSRAKLDQLIKKAGEKKEGQGATGIPRRGGDPSRARLSSTQKRLWVIDQLVPGSPVYNIPGALRFRGELGARALAASLTEIARRHEILRTVYTTTPAGEPEQVIAPPSRQRLPVVDLGALAEGDREAGLRRLHNRAARASFDLTRGPVWRTVLLRLGERDHALSLIVHHIAFDGWSNGVLVRELGALYGAFAAGRPSPLPEPPIQFADYAVWQQERLAGPELAKDLAFWRERLVNLPDPLELPADRPRPAVPSFTGSTHRAALGAELTASLSALARSSGTTLFTALLAGFAALLGRLADQRDVVIGSPIANRNRVETEGLIGFFVNTLVLRVPLRSDPSFSAIIARAADMTLGAFSHQDVPLELLVEELARERDATRAALFQVVFAFQNTGAAELALPGLALSSLGAESTTAKFDLTVILAEGGGGIRGAWEFSADLFDEATVARFASAFEALLTAAVASPSTPLSRLPLLSAAEREQVVRELNDTASAFPRGATAHALFAEMVAAGPDHTAVVAGEETLSYGELEARAARLAQRLTEEGVGLETPVAFYLERTPTMLVATLAIVAAGGYYVPLDPAYPAERLRFLVEDSGAPLVLTTSDLAPELPATAARVLVLDAEAEPRTPRAGRAPAVLPENLVYVIYTSGSTGKPKGAAIPHQGVVRLVRESNFLRFSPADRVAQGSNVSFDAATLEIWGALGNGAALVLIPRDDLAAPEVLAATLARERITVLWLTAALFNQAVRQVPGIFREGGAVLFGGEAADPAAVALAFDTGAPRALINGYGPTESTTFTATHLVEEKPAAGQTIPIGRPVAATSTYVVDHAFAPRPLGVPGELLIGGFGLARGYLGRPGLTAERFVPDALSGEPGARLYRTGDRVRWLPGGRLDFLGRFDHQVKLRGFRIELGEIEAAFTALPEVTGAAVLLREDEPGQKRLVAYVASPRATEEDGGAGLAQELKRGLAAALPDYMVPAQIAVLPELPVTPNGKVDRKALPAPGAASPAAAGGYAAPRTPLEELVAGLWASVLRLPRVGAHDDFFELGGHSLLATQVTSRLRGELGVEIPLRRFFEAPTVAELARVIAEEQAAVRGAALPPITRAERPAEIPLSFAQERLWFLERLDPGTPAYTIATAVRFDGPLAAFALAGSLTRIVARHEALRTVFSSGAEGAVQQIRPAARVRVPLFDLSGLPMAERERVAQRLARRDATTPLDIERGPLLTARLLRLGSEAHVFLLNQHHIASDGWSTGVLIRELAELYPALLAGEEKALPELPIQYADFALWQRRHLAGAELERQLAYWRDALAGLPEVLELPTDRPRPPVATARGERLPLRFDAELSARLRELARAAGATLFMVLLAAWEALLARLTGAADFAVGSPIANRNRLETEHLIGFFVNTLVLRARVGRDASFRSLVAAARTATLDAYAHQDLPFEKLVAEVARERSRAHAPLFQVLFVLQNTGDDVRARAAAGALGEVALAGLRLSPFATETGTVKFDLNLALRDTEAGIGGLLGYKLDLFDRTTIERLIDSFVSFTAALAAAPERPLASLPLLSASEVQQQLREWNDRRRAERTPRGVHHLFEEQAARAPEAPALLHAGRTLSYGELNRRANAVAARLWAAGVGMDDAVAVLLERGIDAIVAILGALKAGAAYLPLDPTTPAERIAFLLADARPKVVLTEVGEEERNDGPRPAFDPEAAAVLIYTSGSTGKPKGVVNSHRALADRIQTMVELFELTPRDRQLQFATLTFDMSCEELFPTLACGGAVVIETEPTKKKPLEVLRDAGRAGVTKINFPSSYWHQVADELAAAGEGVPPSLRLAVTGAEPPSPEKFAELARRAVAPLDGLNYYGPTEATIFVCGAPIFRRGAAPLPAPAIGPISLGRPIAGCWIHLLDRAFLPVPQGVAGELTIGGCGIARGYLGRPGLTAERFVPDAFGGAERPAGARLYRTGDLARRRADGALEFLGRLDTQVKVRGYRIEVGEIEEALRHHPAVAEAAVLARADALGAKRLVAYLVAKGEEPPASALRAFLLERLPEYMVPALFLWLSAMPKSPSGKVDRKALPAPEDVGREAEVAYEPPANALETFLAELWGNILGAPRVGRGDGFFALGGDSIKGAVFINRVEAKLGDYVYVTALFETETLAELATFLGTHYSERVAEVFGEASLPAEVRAKAQQRAVRRMGEADLAALVRLVEEPPPLAGAAPTKNPRAVFILSPPRSGSTLLRVLLAGSPELFAPPELELLPFNTMAARARAFAGRYSFWLEGSMRALMEIHGLDAAGARAMAEAEEAQGITVQESYRRMQAALGGRLLVDKTPSYALHECVLERVEALFEAPLYIHLLRHPYGMIRSFEEARLEQTFFRWGSGDYSRRELAELIWTLSHQNILSFLGRVPQQRQHIVRFEDMVSRPEAVMRELSSFLGIEFRPEMVKPYEEKEKRMTDGIHPLAKMLGDVKFHTHTAIDASVAERWREAYKDDFLGAPTKTMARRLGFEVPAEGPPRRAPSNCLVALKPGAPAEAPLFAVHGVFGDIHFLRHLAAELPRELPVYGLQAAGLLGEESPASSIEELAATYLEAIRSVRPHGPYRLIGSSMGGFVAYEMAVQLARSGEQVELLALLDSVDPGYVPEVSHEADLEVALLGYLLGEVPAAARALAALPRREERLAAILRQAREAGRLSEAVDEARLARMVAVMQHNTEAMLAYRPLAYPGRLLHVRAAASAAKLDDPASSGWVGLAADGAVHVIPGNHMSIHFPPHAAELARLLARELFARELLARQLLAPEHEPAAGEPSPFAVPAEG